MKSDRSNSCCHSDILRLKFGWCVGAKRGWKSPPRNVNDVMDRQAPRPHSPVPNHISSINNIDLSLPRSPSLAQHVSTNHFLPLPHRPLLPGILRRLHPRRHHRSVPLPLSTTNAQPNTAQRVAPRTPSSRPWTLSKPAAKSTRSFTPPTSKAGRRSTAPQACAACS
jgi:hypothetical protein